jgi:hypothetical protein
MDSSSNDYPPWQHKSHYRRSLKDGSLQLCVDYRAFNGAPVMNRYSLPLISDMLDWLHGVRIFTNVDHPNVCHLIGQHEGNEYKTAFRTWDGQLEY